MANRVRRPNVVYRFYVKVLAVLMALAGIALAVGGAWLLGLGGSGYYAIAGTALIVSAILIFDGRVAGFWLYLVLFAFTVAWALWERGLNGWAQVPRLAAPAFLLVLLLTTLPALRRLDPAPARAEARLAFAAALSVVALGITALLLPMLRPGPAVAQVAQGSPSVTAPAPAEDVPTTGSIAARPAQELLEVGADWPAYGGTNHALRFTPLDQITRDNVASLEKAWEFRTGDMPAEDEDSELRYAAETTPIKIGDRIYLCSARNIIIALDAATGREWWRYDPNVSDSAASTAVCRGVTYYENAAAQPGEPCATRIFEATLDARLIAVDAKTGTPCPDFGANGTVDLLVGMGDTVPGWYRNTSPPIIVRGIIVVGGAVRDGQAEDAPSGVVRGYDAVTGELAWAWDLGNPALTGEPAAGEFYTRGTPNMWTTASGDEELGLVYLPLGNSAVDYYGSNRSEAENQYATSLVALDVTTGREAWHFQTVYRDVWDYDLGSTATLVDFPTESGTVPGLILSSKQGDIYVLDRRSGEPLVPFEERPVPQGGVEPDYLSPVQPFSLYNTLARRDLTEADMWGMSPIDQLWCRILFRQAEYAGIYTPPTTGRFWLEYPGYNGGSDWGGVAVDPARGIVIANYNDMPNHNRLVPREEADAVGLKPIYEPGGGEETSLGEASPQIGAPYATEVNAGTQQDFTKLMCKEPPYGGIRAIELGTGRTLWDKPFGQARGNGPFGIPSMLPLDIGTPNNGGAVLTASGLVFIAAATDNLFRAIDIETGEVIWETALPAGGQANPFAFEVDGKQFVGIMAGGHYAMDTPIGDYVITWALPG
jgi:quinoprotein glucose dehydrogenase